MNSTVNSDKKTETSLQITESVKEESQLSPEIKNHEYLYRGVVLNNWDLINNRISSAAFKDTGGASVDRDGGREESECIKNLLQVKDFKAICKIKAEIVRSYGAIILYKPIKSNIFHSEIHDSTERIQMRGSKPDKLRRSSLLVYINKD